MTFRSLRFFKAALLLLLFAAPHAAALAGQVVVPPGGTPLLPAGDAALGAFTVTGQAGGAQSERVAVIGQPFAQALRLRTKTRPAEVYSLQLAGAPAAPVKKGDVLLATFFVRAVEGGQAETGEARTEFVFERTSAPHTKAVTLGVAIPRGQWRRIDVPFKAVEDLAANQARISFRLGYVPQVFELASVSLVNYQNKVALKDLPRTRASYAGREPDAPWRKEALARIEKIRKGDLRVNVVDNNKPVSDAVITLRMKKHAFPFGSAVAAEMLLKTGPDADKYRNLVATHFNRVVLENDLKWPNYEANPERARKGVAWLREHNIAVRGHTLVWPAWRWLPRDLPGLKNNKAALKKRIEDHIKSEAGALRGQLVAWDVVNEPFRNHDLMDILGDSAMIDWFRLARATDSAPQLFLNDYPPLDGEAVGSNPHLDNFAKNIEFLKNNGAPISGIGFQCHFGGSPIPPARLLSGLDVFSRFGLPITATEFDINTTDEALQADYLRDFMTALFSHPSVDGIMMWGFWEGRHWLPDAALWRKDWTLKPSGQAWLDLVTKTWWTSADGRTDQIGAFAARGFLGDYEITVTAGGRTKIMPATLAAGGTTVRVALD